MYEEKICSLSSEGTTALRSSSSRGRNVLSPVASCSDRDLQKNANEKNSPSPFSPAALLCRKAPFLCSLRRLHPSRRAVLAHHGGLYVEILFWSFVRGPQTGPVPLAHPGVHLLEHDQQQVRARTTSAAIHRPAVVKGPVSPPVCITGGRHVSAFTLKYSLKYLSRTPL